MGRGAGGERHVRKWTGCWGAMSRVQARAVQVDLQSPCRAARAVPLLQRIRVTGSQGAEAQVRSWAGVVTAVMSWPWQRPSVLDSCPGASALDCCSLSLEALLHQGTVTC